MSPCTFVLLISSSLSWNRLDLKSRQTILLEHNGREVPLDAMGTKDTFVTVDIYQQEVIWGNCKPHFSAAGMEESPEQDLLLQTPASPTPQPFHG